MKARKWIVTGVTAGVLAGGAAGFMVTVPGGAGAATSNSVQAADTDVNGETIVMPQHHLMPQHHGQPHRGEHGGPRGKVRGAALEAAASVIGVTTDELKAALQSGQSIADVAAGNGVDPQAVIDALVAEATTNLTQRITDMVNGVRPADAPAEEPAN